jgi:hypothetical protein
MDGYLVVALGAGQERVAAGQARMQVNLPTARCYVVLSLSGDAIVGSSIPTCTVS